MPAPTPDDVPQALPGRDAKPADTSPTPTPGDMPQTLDGRRAKPAVPPPTPTPGDKPRTPARAPRQTSRPAAQADSRLSSAHRPGTGSRWFNDARARRPPEGSR